MKLGRRGFSLVEILVALTVLSILLGLALVNYRGGARRAQPQAAATVLAGELQAAHQRAIAGHTFVVLSFPSNGLGSCQSFSRWEGLSQASYRNGRNFSQEFANTAIFVGSWPVSSGSFSTNRPANGREIPGFSLSQWFAPAPLPTDHLLVFSPSGSVSSNDLPLYNGRYVLVVGSGIQAVAGGPPPGAATVSPRPPYFTLQAIADPYRIELDTTGSVSVSAGLGPSSGVQLQAGASPSQPSAPLVPPGLGSNQAPVVQDIRLSPSAPNLPGSLQGAVNREDYLRLTVEASDLDGDALTCQWTATGGAFTSGRSTAMVWDQTRQRWVSTWTFRADPNDAVNTHYDLTCEVRDPAGTLGTAAAGVTLTQAIEVRLKPFFVGTDWPINGLYTCNEDGSDLSRIPLPGMQPGFASVHPDGKTIAFTDQDYTNLVFQIWSVNKDGSGLRRMTNPATISSAGAFSPDGTKYCFQRNNTLEIMPACGEVDPTPQAALQLPPRILSLPAGVANGWIAPSFSQDSQKLVFTGMIGGNVNMAAFVYDLATDTCTQVTPALPRDPNQPSYVMRYSRNPAYPNVLVGRQETANTWSLCMVNDDGSNFRVIPSPVPPVWLDFLAPTRDGLGMVLCNNSKIHRFDLDMNTATTSNLEQIVNVSRINEVEAW